MASAGGNSIGPVLLHLTKRTNRGKRTRTPDAAQANREFGEWLSLVEHLVRDQGVGGSNPLSPTIIFNILQHLAIPPYLSM